MPRIPFGKVTDFVNKYLNSTSVNNYKILIRYSNTFRTIFLQTDGLEMKNKTL